LAPYFSGQEDYDRLRPLSYPNASVFLLCFAVSSRTSFGNIREKWHRELTKYNPTTPFVLVGTQVDRRTNGSSTFVSTEEGVKMAREIGAINYVECSALSREGLRDVFTTALMAALDPKKAKATSSLRRSRKCSIL